jgi:hypothetical protein
MKKTTITKNKPSKKKNNKKNNKKTNKKRNNNKTKAYTVVNFNAF